MPEIGFRREVSKQLSKGEDYPLPLLGSDQARELERGAWKPQPGESSEMKCGLAGLHGEEPAGALPSGRAQCVLTLGDGQLPP